MAGEMKRREMQDALGLKHEEHFRKAYLLPALKLGGVEMTLPSKPRSSKQRYRITQLGEGVLKKLREGTD
jgi:ATP-dependent DNA helicase RecG